MTPEKIIEWASRLQTAVRSAPESLDEAIAILTRLHEEVAHVHSDLEHSVLQILVGLLINQRRQLPLAEKLTQRLLELCSDRMHHQNLLQIYKLQGDKAATSRAERDALKAPNIHLTPEFVAEYEKVMAIVEGAIPSAPPKEGAPRKRRGKKDR